MADFIVRKCIKNYDQVEDPHVRTAYGVVGSAVGIICNLALFVLKFLIGIAIHSMAVTADAIWWFPTAIRRRTKTVFSIR